MSKEAYQQASINSDRRKESLGIHLQPVSGKFETEEMVIGPSGGYMPTKAFMITSKQRNPYKPNSLRQKTEDGEEMLIKGCRRSKSRDRVKANRASLSPSTISGKRNIISSQRYS
jgi:hypothetical protein